MTFHVPIAREFWSRGWVVGAPATTATQTTLHRPSWTFLRVVSLLEGGPTSPVGKDPATRRSPAKAPTPGLAPGWGPGNANPGNPGTLELDLPYSNFYLTYPPPQPPSLQVQLNVRAANLKASFCIHFNLLKRSSTAELSVLILSQAEEKRYNIVIFGSVDGYSRKVDMMLPLHPEVDTIDWENAGIPYDSRCGVEVPDI
ncbi:hypothetical protein L3Q82_005890 [Scortum barcoo]|uniref:Uncharacterized protein n=1 Tax=Scortum barcoo TaxID=214431 RepID=A0ACB8V6Z0_9TELE|nr:hypothetical protein L3Q82_005890 [Scortum barcoo]